MNEITFNKKFVDILLVVISLPFFAVVAYLGFPALKYFFEVDVMTSFIYTCLFLYICCLGFVLFFLGLRKDSISSIFTYGILATYLCWFFPLMYFMIKSWF